MSKAEILDLLPTLRPDERQETLDRLSDLQEAELHTLHQGWVNEALRTAPPWPRHWPNKNKNKQVPVLTIDTRATPPDRVRRLLSG